MCLSRREAEGGGCSKAVANAAVSGGWKSEWATGSGGYKTGGRPLVADGGSRDGTHCKGGGGHPPLKRVPGPKMTVAERLSRPLTPTCALCAHPLKINPGEPPQRCIGRGGTYLRAPIRAPSLCPAPVPVTASASFNGICNRQ